MLLNKKILITNNKTKQNSSPFFCTSTNYLEILCNRSVLNREALKLPP
jgi:hypothetical protein